MRTSELLIAKFVEAGDHADGVMVAAYPNESTLRAIKAFVKKLKLNDPLDGDKLHLTLRYFKKADYKDFDKLKRWLDSHVKFSRSKTNGKGIKLKTLGKDESAKHLVLIIESDSIKELQEKLDKGMQELGVPKSEFPEFLPHITLEYDFKGEIPEEVPDIDIGISAIKLAHDDEILWEYDGN